MPYRPPSFSGLVKEVVSVYTDGHVEIDGKAAGFIETLDIHTYNEFRSSNSESYEISFTMTVVKQPYEPDAVYNLTGKKLGYIINGILVPKKEDDA